MVNPSLGAMRTVLGPKGGLQRGTVPEGDWFDVKTMDEADRRATCDDRSQSTTNKVSQTTGMNLPPRRGGGSIALAVDLLRFTP